MNFEKKCMLQFDRENITEVIQCKFFTNFLDKGILIFMTLQGRNYKIFLGEAELEVPPS